jgi:membrane-bound lytic murein transglycosylase D
MEPPQQPKEGRVLWLRHNRPSNVPVEYRKAADTPSTKKTTETNLVVEHQKKEQLEKQTAQQKESELQNSTAESQVVDSISISSDSLEFDSKQSNNTNNARDIEQDSILASEELKAATLDTSTVKTEKVSPSILEKDETEADVQIADENDDEPNFDENQFRNYSIKKGDTFFAIANRFNMKISTLLNVNDLGIRDTLSIGQVIKVNKNGYSAEPPIEEEKEIRNNTTLKPEREIIAKNIEHKVTSGDTMYALAKKYDVSLKEIMEWNNKQDYSLKEGELILIKQK